MTLHADIGTSDLQLIKHSFFISNILITIYLSFKQTNFISKNSQCLSIHYSEENLDYELDPLHSEPKRIRKRQDKYPCSQCEYCATTRSL